jgi:hypothetical protein
VRRAVLVVAAVFATLAGTASAAEPPPLSVSTSLSPNPAFFGERVAARAEIVVHDDAVDPSSVRFTPDFAPYAVVGEPRTSRAAAGSVTTLGFVYTLQCLDDGCLPGASMRKVALPRAAVVARRRDGRSERVSLRWQSLLVAPRVTSSASDASPPRWRVQLALPPVSYSMRPATASTVGGIAAALLACAGVALVAWELVRRRRIALARARAMSELARAVARVRESEGRPVDDRRRALSLLSRVLVAHGNGDAQLADDATRLAWDRPEPSPGRIEELLRDVETKLVAR